MVPAPLVEPTLSAMMCDGMGWFSSADLKRVLLVFDEVKYLLPRETVEFTDRDGESRFVWFPPSILTSDIVDTCHYSPDADRLEMVLAAAGVDAADPKIVDVVRSIPAQERLYTWRVVNSDSDLGHGASLGLSAHEEVEAHLIALNRFLLAADASGCVPVSGKDYIHRLIAEKYSAVRRLDAAGQTLLPEPLETAVKLRPWLLAL